MSAAAVTEWVTEILTNGSANGLTAREIATLVRSLSAARATSSGCYVYGESSSYSGFTYESGRKTTLHRAMLHALHGELAPDEVARHKCDNPPCIRPSHLEPGTASENTRDAYDRLRMAHVNHAVGMDASNAILTDDQVREIRRLRKQGVIYREIGEMFGVSPNAARSAATGEGWRHVTGEAPCAVNTRPGTTRLRLDRSMVEPKARRDFEAGVSLRRISKEIGVSTGTLTKWKRDWERDRDEQAMAS